MPPKRKVETVEDNTAVPSAKKTSEEETPPISPDKGATGETTSSENKEAGTQTGWLSVTKYKCVKKGSSQQQRTQQISSITFFESEEEKKAHLDEI